MLDAIILAFQGARALVTRLEPSLCVDSSNPNMIVLQLLLAAKGDAPLLVVSLLKQNCSTLNLFG